MRKNSPAVYECPKGHNCRGLHSREDVALALATVRSRFEGTVCMMPDEERDEDFGDEPDEWRSYGDEQKEQDQ